MDGIKMCEAFPEGGKQIDYEQLPTNLLSHYFQNKKK
jgi:hypothetical protein